MGEIITENTIVTIYEVIMDYTYIWGLKVPITKALSEIAKKEKEDGCMATYHICVGDTGLGKFCGIAMNRLHFYEDMCLPNVETVVELLTRNAPDEFVITEDRWSLRKSLLASGWSEEKINKLLKE